MKILERLGILKPRYREGWPRGVRPMFPTASLIKSHILTHDPALWEAMCRVPIFEGLTMAQTDGLLEGVGRGAPFSAVRIVQPA